MNLDTLFRVGTGCGIEVRGDDLLVVAAKSRPKGVSVVGRMELARFRERPPHEWGTEYAEFVRDLGLSHLAATVSIPRNDVIVRQIQLPPVKGKDLAAAVHYQIDTLHPFDEDEVYHAYAPLRDVENVRRRPAGRHRDRREAEDRPICGTVRERRHPGQQFQRDGGGFLHQRAGPLGLCARTVP